MKAMTVGSGLLVALATFQVQASRAEDKVRLGVILSLSTPLAPIGQMAKNGVDLALKDLGGKLGGRDVELFVADDEAKPDVAVTKAKALLSRDKVDFIIGPILSSVLGAIVKPVSDAKVFLISPNAGSSALAGKSCNPYFFATSYQNDQVHEVSGKVAQDRGYKRAYIITPNYQAGKDAAAGFRIDYRGEVAEESYVPLNMLDFQSELAKIAAAKPDVVYAFLPGGMGVNFVKQYTQAGLSARIPVLSAFTVDEGTLPAQGDAALGMYSGANWAPDLDTPQNKKFVGEYLAAYGAVPASYAFQAYDAVMLIDSAVKAADGDLSNKDALRGALRKAAFTSLRGAFKFSINGFPVQDFYMTKVGKRPDGKLETQITEKVFSNYADRHVKDCPLTN